MKMIRSPFHGLGNSLGCAFEQNTNPSLPKSFKGLDGTLRGAHDA